MATFIQFTELKNQCSEPEKQCVAEHEAEASKRQGHRGNRSCNGSIPPALQELAQLVPIVKLLSPSAVPLAGSWTVLSTLSNAWLPSLATFPCNTRGSALWGMHHFILGFTLALRKSPLQN